MRRALIGLLLLGSACTARKEAWVSAFEPEMVSGLCKAPYFRECFSVDEAACRSLATRTVHDCLAQHDREIPTDLDKEKGRVAGQLIGSCAGGAFEEALVRQGKRLHTARCDDPAAWGAK